MYNYDNRGIKMFKKVFNVDVFILMIAIYGFLSTLGIAFFLIYAMVNAINIPTRIAFSPFLLSTIAYLIKMTSWVGQATIDIIKKHNDDEKISIVKIENILIIIETLSEKAYIIGLLLFCFGFVIFADYIFLMNINHYGWGPFLSTLIFWIVGIWLCYIKLFKKKKRE